MVPLQYPATSTLPLIDQSAQFSFWLGNAHLSSEASAAHKLRRNGVERRQQQDDGRGRRRVSVGWEAGRQRECDRKYLRRVRHSGL